MLRLCCLVTLYVLLAVAPLRAEERILSFDSDINVQADGAFIITETIRVRAEGRQIRRGIFRDFPTVFEDANGRERKVDFELISVNRDGRTENAAVENGARALRIRIGNGDVFLDAGEYTYEITYRTDRQLRRFDTHDEVYWNVTGTDWAFPIDKASALITLPEGTAIEDTAYFTGGFGAQGKNAVQKISENKRVAAFETTRVLDRREGLTIAVKFNKGVIPEPNQQQQLGWFLKDFLAEIIAFGGLLAVFFYYLWSWMRVGRDPPKSSMVPRWELPDDISPALAHFIHFKGLKKQGFTALSAAALSLAVKGHITLDNKDGDLTINKVPNFPAEALPVGEASLISRLNGQGGSLKIDKAHGSTIKSMAAKFSSAMSGEHRKVFYKHNVGYIVPGVILSVITFIAIIFSGAMSEEMIVFILPVVIFGSFFMGITTTIARGLMSGGLGAKIRMVFAFFFGAVFVSQIGLGTALSFLSDAPGHALLGALLALVMVNVLFFFLMGAPTELGQKRNAEIEGLKRYLSVAEQDRMNMLGSPEMSPQHYEKLLPFAVALGGEKPWSKAFQGWLAAAVAAGAASAVAYHGPHWYDGGRFSPDTIGDTLGNIGTDLASSMTSSLPAPKSSSSGFSGGGSSGGGGGGGGGGGW